MGFPRELWIEIFGKSWSRAIERKGPCLYVCTDGTRRACAVGDCTCIIPTLGGLGETSGPRIDRIPPTRPPWWRRQYRDIKKLIFLAPTTCPSDIIGSFANRTILKQLHARFYHSLKNGFSGTSLYALRRRPSSATPSQRHPKVNKGPLTQKIYQKRRARAPLWAARAGQLCPGFSGGDQSSVSGRGASVPRSRIPACGPGPG